MTKTYYPIMHNRSEKLEVIPKNHEELVVLMTAIFGKDHYYYEEVDRSCAKRMAQEETSKLKRCLEVQ